MTSKNLFKILVSIFFSSTLIYILIKNVEDFNLLEEIKYLDLTYLFYSLICISLSLHFSTLLLSFLFGKIKKNYYFEYSFVNAIHTSTSLILPFGIGEFFFTYSAKKYLNNDLTFCLVQQFDILVQSIIILIYK